MHKAVEKSCTTVSFHLLINRAKLRQPTDFSVFSLQKLILTSIPIQLDKTPINLFIHSHTLHKSVCMLCVGVIEPSLRGNIVNYVQ